MSEIKGTKALELWCKRLVKDCPDVVIDNMTTSWRNGIAFCALVHHFRPDLIDMSSLKPENIYENNQLAFSIAEKHLGIPALLDPEDMVENEVPDRLSILTYLSQFYQRLSHTVNTKASESESKLMSSPAQPPVPIQFGKTGLDKCVACGLPVYLAQRLIVSHKLYHRRCFRCCKCLGHLNPKNFEFKEGSESEFTCDSCKNDKTIPKFLNNNDQMGMLAFSDTASSEHSQREELVRPIAKPRTLSILEKINMFEKNSENLTVEEKIGSLNLKNNHNDLSATNLNSNSEAENRKTLNQVDIVSELNLGHTDPDFESVNSTLKNKPDKIYKSNIRQYNFLQTQLTNDNLSNSQSLHDVDDNIDGNNAFPYNEECLKVMDESTNSDINIPLNKDNKVEDNNITDDIRVKKDLSLSNLDILPLETESKQHNQIEKIAVPPRRKKNVTSEKTSDVNNVKLKENSKDYPTHLNPFSDDEEEIKEHKENVKKESTNPFGSTDEDDEVDDLPPIQSPPRVPAPTTLSMKRLIPAHNPFWSDGEEPSSDDESRDGSDKLYKSSLATSTPNLPAGIPRRRKPRAPPPPPAISLQPPTPAPLDPSASMDDLVSISSVSSYNSDQKSFGKVTPRLKKKRLAPTPPDSLSTVSCGGSVDKVIENSDPGNSITDSGRRIKGPAPGLPLPERREVKLQITPEELQIQLDLLETQQLGLERQGVLIEQMIRDKCEGDEASSVPQEEVEDLVIQLCELVNEKNDLFRKQTELMYIRRQQRLEQEQADIEHEIRVIQSQPAVNRIDADKVREEQLVSRLVAMVRLRDELVQQLDAERRREQQEDIAIAASIATKRAQRNSESNSSSMKSVEVTATPKKSKVKDKVKKQLKKAKHSLIAKKKDDSAERKEDKGEKEKKSKQALQ